MVRYDSPSTWNLTEPSGIITGITNSTGTALANMVLLAIAVIFIGGYWFARRDAIESFAVGTFVAWVVGVIFFTAGFVGFPSLMMVTVFMIIGFAGLWIEKKA